MAPGSSSLEWRDQPNEMIAVDDIKLSVAKVPRTLILVDDHPHCPEIT